MKEKRMKRRYPGLLVLLLLFLFCRTVPVQAYGLVEEDAVSSLTIRFQDGGTGIEGAKFSVFRIAEVTEMARYHLTGAFEDYPVSLEVPDSAGWRALALTLESYAMRDQITPDTQGETDEHGELVLSNLQTGLYLVTGQPVETGDYTWTPEAFICSLPDLTEDDNWNYDVSAVVKYDSVYTGEPTSRRVVKVWENDEASDRPQMIEVQLLKDGEVEDTQILNGENNWSYTWNGLDARSEWNVVEKEVPAGYTVSEDREGTSVFITNTGTNEKETAAPDTKLPQTGVLWWPVPVLAAAGCLLFLIGWFRHRRKGRE